MLTTVTITGADDRVEPKQLEELSLRYPFVEWGILLSASRAGESRYPTVDWWRPLPEKAPHARLSAHVCGAMARGIEHATVGAELFLVSLPAAYRRVQINGISSRPPAAFEDLMRHLGPEREFILQARSLDDLGDVAIAAVKLPNASVLFDASGGRGIAPAAWPWLPASVRLGFAGGIRPSTAEAVLREIGERSRPFWIDMESGVRIDDQFDLALVDQALAAAEPFVQRS